MASMDKGVDIMARKDGHVFDIRVKTASRHPTGAFITPIGKRPFDNSKAQNMYYAFVLRDGLSTHFVVLPFAEAKKCIEEGRIKKYPVSFYENSWNLGQLV